MKEFFSNPWTRLLVFVALLLGPLLWVGFVTLQEVKDSRRDVFNMVSVCAEQKMLANPMVTPEATPTSELLGPTGPTTKAKGVR